MIRLGLLGYWSWNVVEASLGFPVSGILFDDLPLRAATSGSILWTGGAYGPEASLPVTVVLFAGLVLVLRWKQVEDESCPVDSSAQ